MKLGKNCTSNIIRTFENLLITMKRYYVYNEMDCKPYIS